MNLPLRVTDPNSSNWFHQMLTVCRSLVIVWPELDHPDYFPIGYLEERDHSRRLNTIRYGYIADGLIVITHNLVDGEMPAAMSRIFFIHCGEIVLPKDPLVRLRPFKHVIISQHGPDRAEIVGLH